MDLYIVPCAAFGFLLGVVSGLIPGLHVNTFAAILLGASPVMMKMGLSPYHVAVIILAASISQTFLDAIPTVFVGAPDSDTVLAVLPGHRLMLRGRGIEAVRLSAMGSAGSVLVALSLIPFLSWLFSSYYDLLMEHIGLILLSIAALMIMKERDIDPRMYHTMKRRALALSVFLTSGLLGIFAFGNQDLLSSPLGLEPDVLLPLLSGIFGAPSLILSIFSSTGMAEQRDTGFDLPAAPLVRSIIMGGAAGSLVAWIPGVSPAVATMLTRLGRGIEDEDQSAREFLVSISGVNTSCAMLSLVALVVIGRPRSGAAAAINELIELDAGQLYAMMAIATAIALVSYVTTVWLACIAGSLLSKIDYRNLSIIVLGSLALITFIFTGTFGIFIFLISTLIGLAPHLAGIRKTHAMGVLMLPLIIYYLSG
ncbi:MAG TPA: tripartite tricarboxylate transporter permease [Methanothrix sp.]|nr:tripartite tricarboxylate transporter permease [Methanothrix sp.]HOK58548.1 tripartite tricarboxylate transporter permease [Methanothrix sp.]HOL43717.1 tripartite tricarboxylate transporter permease [Methanothrix sp.]HPO88725.1 tripartite tricarboxylate transporter permease [Methanothrix sp.]